MMHLPLRACSDNNGKVDEEKHYHTEDLHPRSDILVPGEPFRWETEEDNCGKDEKRDWGGLRTRPFHREQKHTPDSIRDCVSPLMDDQAEKDCFRAKDSTPSYGTG